MGGGPPIETLDVTAVQFDGLGGVRERITETFRPQIGKTSVAVVDGNSGVQLYCLGVQFYRFVVVLFWKFEVMFTCFFGLIARYAN